MLGALPGSPAELQGKVSWPPSVRGSGSGVGRARGAGGVHLPSKPQAKKKSNFLAAGLRSATPSIAGAHDTQPHPAPAVPSSIKSSGKMKN